MFRLVTLSILVTCFILNIIVKNDAAPLQSLPQKPGYIPVYIRYGDTPLEEINPGLAVAFREFGGEARNIRENDKEEMLADEPAPDSVSESIESKEDEVKTTKAPVTVSESDSESQSVENDTKEVPHALPVKEDINKIAQ